MNQEFSQSKSASWGLIVFTVLIVLALSAIVSTLRAQEYSRADSLSYASATDSTFRVYMTYTTEADQMPGYLSEQMDSSQTVNLIYNALYDARLGTQYAAARLLFRSGQVAKLKVDVDAALTAMTGLNYLQLSEARYIREFATKPYGASGGTQSYYNLKVSGTTYLIRIRENGAIREVNSQGNVVAGGIQGNLRIWAGTSEIEFNLTAGGLGAISVFLYMNESVNGRARWQDVTKTYTLTRRRTLNDAGAAAQKQ